MEPQGRTARADHTFNGREFTNAYTVIGPEDLTTRGGSFKTVKLAQVQTSRAGDYRHVRTYLVLPDSSLVVKYTVRVTTGSGRPGNLDWEVVSVRYP